MPESKLWRTGPVLRLVGFSLLAFSGFCATLSALPAWLAAGGVAPTAAGAVTAVLLGATVVTQSFVPAAAARLGTGRCLALGLLLMGVPVPLYLLAGGPLPALPVAVVAAVVRGSGFGVLTVLGSTLTAVLAPPGRHGEVTGLYGAAIAVPNLAVVPLGVVLVQHADIAPVAVLAALPVLAVPIALGMPDPAPRPDLERRGATGRYVRAAVPPALVLLGLTLAVGGVLTYTPIVRPAGPLAPVAILLLGLTGALGRFRAGVLGDRFGTRVLLPVAVACGGIGLVATAAGLTPLVPPGAPAAAVLLSGAAVLGLGYGSVQTLTMVVAFARAGDGGAPTASAVWNTGFDSGTGLGALAVGALATAGLGVPGAYLACAVLVALTLPLALRTAVAAPA